jgi:predicted outer membrane repeat protein
MTLFALVTAGVLGNAPDAHAQVKAHQKISDTEGGFTGTLKNNDRFGNSGVLLGDLDNDGVDDMAVGAYLDDYGNTQRGAVWVLFLNSDGTVKSHQKITEGEGGFTGDLDVWDTFGISLESLGDLDGDSVCDLAVGASLDDDGGTNRGAVWILFLNTDGTVKSHQKISDTAGGFTGTLDDEDFFGQSIASLEDFDGDGVIDLAVGARLDDDGGYNRGAVWILYLNSDGTVKSQQKISDTEGGFTGTLEDEDWFSSSLTSLGDYDGDGVVDLAAGAFGDNDGGANRGAVWILFLNSDGTVKSHQKISDTEGGFTGPLDDSDVFGGAVAYLGDLYSTGRDVLAVSAKGDDDGGTDRGAVWLLSLNTDGTVNASQKISSTQGGFAGDLDDGDAFGGGPVALGDFDGDGMGDMAVGAQLDDDGGDNRGAVWMLFLEVVPGECDVQPMILNFGAIAMGDSADLDFKIYNIGSVTLNGSVSESCQHYEIAAGAGSYSLAPGDSHTVTVRFKPTLIGTCYCTIQTGADCANVSCEGISYEPPPACLIEPEALDFGNVDVGEFNIMTFDITNTGYGTLAGTMSESCTHFDIMSGGTYSLTHDQSQTVSIFFAPGTEGYHECTIETGNDACTDVNCMGSSGSSIPVCDVDADTLEFGTVIIGNYSDLDFFITNTGADTLRGTVSELCDHYSITAGEGAYALTTGETVFVTVRFEPTLSGGHSCSIETGTMLCGSVYCTGIGMDPPLCVMEPDTLDFGTVLAGTFSDLDFFIANAGGDTLSGDVSETCDYYSITAGGGAYALAAGETVFVTVRFEPTMSGNHTCMIETGTVLCGDVYCTGEGNICVVDPDTLDFGTVVVGDSLDMEFDIINVSDGIMSGTVSDTCMCFDVVAGGGPYGLAPGETLHVMVRFKPNAESSFDCWVETGVECGDVYCTGEGDDVIWYIKPDGSGDAPTIQAGIDSADAGEFVVLASGTFSGTGNNSIDFHRKAITVMSESGAELTIIDCQEAGGFDFYDDQGISSVLSGLTITNASCAVYIYMFSGTLTIENCIITNSDTGVKAGEALKNTTNNCEKAPKAWPDICIENCTFTDLTYGVDVGNYLFVHITACTFTGCQVGVNTLGSTNINDCTFSANSYGIKDSWWDILGNTCHIVNCEFSTHTIYAATNSVVPFAFNDCIFLNNHSTGSGGAIRGFGAIRNSTFIGNSSDSHGGAISIVAAAWPAIPDYITSVEKNLFYNNTSNLKGGAIFTDQAPVVIASNTMVENASTAHQKKDKGAGGVHMTGTASGDVANNIIAFSTDGLGGVVCPAGTLSCNDIYGNVGGDSIWGIDGGDNFSADPIFCEPDSGNFGIRDDSPCVPDNSPSGCGLIGADSVKCSSGTGVVEPEISVPSSFYLGPAVPNPFNPVTTIRFGIPEDHKVRITVHDVAGRLVATLVEDYFAAGDYSAQWNGRNSNGADVASGVYFARLVAGEFASTRKLVLLK